MSKGYSFNLSHTLAYSLVALQEMNLAYKYPMIFWDCANLIVDSGAIDGIDAKSANYNKIANAVNKIKSQTSTNISLVDINKSEKSFTPDVENNLIYYGMAGIQGVGSDVIQQIIENRPYSSFADFQEKNNFNKTVITMLIKSGAFDQFGERADIMKQYLTSVANTKKRLNLQNFKALSEKNLFPQELKFQERLFRYNAALKKNCKYQSFFLLDKPNYYKFYANFFDVDLLEPVGNGSIGIQQKKWKTLYDGNMLAAKQYITKNQEKLLSAYNKIAVDEMVQRYAYGSYSHWEMESLGMYWHDHELKNLKENLYDIVHFKDLPEQAEVEYNFKRGGNNIPIFKTCRIAGTVIAKDDLHSSCTILTNDNEVVPVKMTKDYYARYNKRISQIQPDGTKKVMEPGFLQRGTLVVLNGYRRGANFILKKYKKTKSHQFYKITKMMKDGRIEMTHRRYDDPVEEN